MRLALASLGLIFGFTGVFIGSVMTLNTKPFVSPYTGSLFFVVSAAMLVFSIRFFYYWGTKQREEITDRILSDNTQLVAHWRYHLNQWKYFSEAELKKGRQAVFAALWIAGIALLLIAILVFYFNNNLQWVTLQYILLGFALVMMVGYFLAIQHQNRKRRAFLDPVQPEVHLSHHGLLINKQWPITFKKINVSLIKVEKINLHQETCLRFEVKISSGEGDSIKKYHIPVPKDKVEHLPEIIDTFRKNITVSEVKKIN